MFKKSAHLQVNTIPLQRAAVVEGQLFQGDVVVGQGADFGGARRGQAVLQLQRLLAMARYKARVLPFFRP